jgi:two-component system response regulator
MTTVDTMDVLLVEDDAGDVTMIEEAFGEFGVAVRLHVAEDGERAIDFLRRIGEFAAAPRPQLILLDLNLPRRSGLEVLEELKSDPDLLSIPVVVLTTSAAPEDVVRSYALHANAYVTKPTDFDSFADAVRQIANWFLELIELPRSRRASPGSGLEQPGPG